MPKAVKRNSASPKSEEAPRSSVTAGRGATSVPTDDIRGSRVNRVRRAFKGYTGPVLEIAEFLSQYIVLPEVSFLVIATWIVASYMMDKWDRYPHLAINSPEKRCGKTLLLDLLFLLVLRPRYTTNISPAAIYRLIEKENPTLLMDEAQSVNRRGSEASEVTREILNAGIGRKAKVTRCAGENREDVEEFSVYGPKVFAFIGDLDAVLADRSLPVHLRRKTAADSVQRYRSRIVDKEGAELQKRIEKWANDNAEQVAAVYDGLEPFEIENDRMADLLLPLQAVLTVLGNQEPLDQLEEYAKELDDRDAEQESQSVGVQLLIACREVFKGFSFIGSDKLISKLAERKEEPWHRLNRGQEITREGLANLLRPYGIRSSRNKEQTARGYHAADFADAWSRYIPLINPANPTIPSGSAKAKGKK